MGSICGVSATATDSPKVTAPCQLPAYVGDVGIHIHVKKTSPNSLQHMCMQLQAWSRNTDEQALVSKQLVSGVL